MKNIFNKRRRERRAFEVNVEYSLQNLHSRIGNLELINLMLWGDPKQDGWVGDMQTMRNKLRCMGATQDEVKHINTLTVSTALAVADAKSLAKDAAVNTVEIHNRIQEVFDKLVVMDKRMASAPVFDPVAMRNGIAAALIQSKNAASNTHGVGERQQNIVARLDAICTRLDNIDARISHPSTEAEKILDAVLEIQKTCIRLQDSQRAEDKTLEQIEGATLHVRDIVQTQSQAFARVLENNDRVMSARVDAMEKMLAKYFGDTAEENRHLRQQVSTLKGQVTRAKNQAKKAAYTSDPKIGFPKKIKKTLDVPVH